MLWKAMASSDEQKKTSTDVFQKKDRPEIPKKRKHPELQLVDDQLPVEVEREGREHVQGADTKQEV